MTVGGEPKFAEEAFSAEVVGRFRRAAGAVRETLRRDGPDKWCRAEFDASQLIAVFPSLALRPGYRLLTYLYQEGCNGNGRVVALAEDSDAYRKAKAVPAWTPIAWAPGEEEGVTHPMQVIDGDGSPLAYLSASLLAREFREVGAAWHGIAWDVESIIAPTKAWLIGEGRRSKHNMSLLAALERLTWPSGCPSLDSLAPVAHATDLAAEVLFYTYSELGGRHVTRWKDIYSTGSHVPSTEHETVASGPGGFVF